MDLIVLDRFSKSLVATIQTDADDGIFAGDDLNSRYASLADLIAVTFGEAVGSKDQGVNVLYEGFTIAQLAEGFIERWSNSPLDLIDDQPIVCELQKAKAFKSSPDYAEVSRLVGDIPVALAIRPSSFTRNGQEYVIVLLRPKFPEWYFYSDHPEGVSHEQRRELLPIIERSVAEVFEGRKRLDPDDVSGLYYFFVHEVVPEVFAQAKTDAGAKELVNILANTTSFFVPGGGAESIFDIPFFWMEYLMFLFANAMEEDFFPVLRAKLAEARAS
ncbi:hypothetical protein [Pannonibacter sp.]|uniref:hypothetical protein n=1 Tax=Pannonibacter sp. TaxID=1906786 RepID=UPI003F7026C5